MGRHNHFALERAARYLKAPTCFWRVGPLSARYQGAPERAPAYQWRGRARGAASCGPAGRRAHARARARPPRTAERQASARHLKIINIIASAPVGALQPLGARRPAAGSGPARRRATSSSSRAPPSRRPLLFILTPARAAPIQRDTLGAPARRLAPICDLGRWRARRPLVIKTAPAVACVCGRAPR